MSMPGQGKRNVWKLGEEKGPATAAARGSLEQDRQIMAMCQPPCCLSL